MCVTQSLKEWKSNAAIEGDSCTLLMESGVTSDPLEIPLEICWTVKKL
jgi:hypothetical protein